MKTTIKLLTALALVLAGFSQYSTALAASTFRFRGESADAFFSNIDGCVLTEVSIFASDAITQSPPGPGEPSSGAGLFIMQFDLCTSTYLLTADGFAQLGPSDLQVDKKLGSATLNTTISVFDHESGTSFDVTVDLTWTADGPETRERFNDHSTFPGCKVFIHSRGRFRPANVTGTISDGLTNFTPDPGTGLISSVKLGDVVIGCN